MMVGPAALPTSLIITCCLSATWVVGGIIVSSTTQSDNRALQEGTNVATGHHDLTRDNHDLATGRHHRRHQMKQQQQQQQQQQFPLALPVQSSQTSLSSGVMLNNTINGATPHFLTPLVNELTTRAGQAAVLTCIVKQLGNRQDLLEDRMDRSLLDQGRQSTENLSAKWAEKQLSQLSRQEHRGLLIDVHNKESLTTTMTKSAQHSLLDFSEARANILGKETMYVQKGSTVSLECVIKEELVIPGLVLWYQDDRLVDRDSGRVEVVTNIGNVTTSTLKVAGAALHDSGNYSCWPSAGRPDSVIVHVIQGDPPAAMHHGNSASWVRTSMLEPAASLILLLLLT
nr:uncharacterized protein LOC128689023 [Cherax quadricarinatus]